jgi:putative ABC transport system substrate-binding protein
MSYGTSLTDGFAFDACLDSMLLGDLLKIPFSTASTQLRHKLGLKSRSAAVSRRAILSVGSTNTGRNRLVNRRSVITLLGGAAVAWPLAARAQQPAMPVIGFLSSESPDLSTERLRAFHQGLGETGHVEGRNVAVEYRWAEGRYDRLPELTADLVRRHAAVIAATGGNASALAAKTATATIPIVFFTGANPVLAGLVASLNRPGGNLTGVTSLGVELGPKRLELLHELVPRATVMALLVNPANRSAEFQVRDVQAAARALGRELHVLHASTEHDIDAAFATLMRLQAGALVIAPESFFNSRAEQLAALTVRHAVPAIFSYRDFAAAGGLMSYGASITDAYHQVGVYAGRVLKGEKPADMPVQQSTRIELIINLRTAKALGLAVPLSVLGRADEVIE